MSETVSPRSSVGNAQRSAAPFVVSGTERVWTAFGSTDVLAAELAALRTQRIALLTSRTLAESVVLRDLLASLGDVDVLLLARSATHVPAAVLESTVADAEAFDPDCVLTVGGGSVTDLGSALRLMLHLGVRDYDELRPYAVAAGMAKQAPAGDYVSATRPFQVCIPTTLSAAECTPTFTVTYDGAKEMYFHAGLYPRLIFLDARISSATPAALWLGTGIRAVDHCVEGYLSRRATPMTDALATHALGLIAAHLPSSEAPQAFDDRQILLNAAWLSAFGALQWLGGLSHAIGHQLGAATGMPHGHTSSVMLPHVLRFNFEASSARQTELLEIMRRANPSLTASTLADSVAELAAALRLPARLRDAGVARSALAHVATNTLDERGLETNAREVRHDDILTLLEEAY